MLGIRHLIIVASAASLTAVVSVTGCGSTGPKFGGDQNAATGDDSGAGGDDDSGSSSHGPSFRNDAGGSDSGCTDGSLACLVRSDCTTTLSGTVYDPAGMNPLYNAVVFVPNDPQGTLPSIATGTKSCSTCDVSIGNYVTATTTDSKGHFTLKGVPATTHVPLVVQIGKWRREVFLSSVKACTDNVVPPASSRLPKNRTEGNIPQMALLTGGADNLGCFLPLIGLDPAEYTAPSGNGRVHVYKGQGGAPDLSGGGAADCTTTSCPLYNQKSSLEKYDIVLLACEGNTFDGVNKTQTTKKALHDWLDEGGKVFATHYHYTWFNEPSLPDFQGLGNWLGSSGAGSAPDQPYDLDTSFPKAMVFHDWLANVNALQGNKIPLTQVATSLNTVSKDVQRWIYDSQTEAGRKFGSTGNANNTKYMSFLTPIGGLPASATDGGTEMSSPQYCGKAVFTDLHVGSDPSTDVPNSCKGLTMTEQLKALEFLFFDLSACVSPDNAAPPDVPPPAK